MLVRKYALDCTTDAMSIETELSGTVDSLDCVTNSFLFASANAAAARISALECESISRPYHVLSPAMAVARSAAMPGSAVVS